MQIGISMPSRATPLARIPEYARLAEEAGFDSVWVIELYRNPFAMLCTAALATSRVGLGTGLAVAGGRSPFEMANAAADVDELSNGRMLLGMGHGVIDWSTAFHSTQWERPLVRISEYLDVLRLSWQYLETGTSESYEGEYFSFRPPPFNPWDFRRPPRPQIPILLAGLGPKMLRLVGEKGDGWLGYLATPSLIEQYVRPHIAEGAARAGRDPSKVELAIEMICSVSDDRAAAMERARIQVGFYLAHPVSAPLIEFAGVGAEVAELQANLMAQGVEALRHTSDTLVETFAIAGTPDEVEGRLAEWQGVVDHLILHTPYLPPIGPDGSDDAYRGILKAFGRS